MNTETTGQTLAGEYKCFICSVNKQNGHWHNDPIHRMVNMMLAENQDMIPEDSIVIKTKLSIHSPKEYSGSPDLKVYETFIAGIL